MKRSKSAPVETERWLEIQVANYTDLQQCYAAADILGCTSIHHFQEPWYPGGSVVRVLIPDKADRGQMARQYGERCIEWEAAPDEKLFDALWPTVRACFEASSRLTVNPATAALTGRSRAWVQRKVIHCTLNSWGYSAEDELRFALQFAWGRVRIIAHCWAWETFRRRGSCRYGCHKPEWAA